jgi:uncharacterized protein (DUF885 family)
MDGDNSTATSDQVVDPIADGFLDDLLAQDPIAATRLGDPRWDDQLPDFGADGREQAASTWQRTLTAMEAIALDGLGDEARITREIVINCARRLLDRFETKHYQLEVAHREGVQLIPTEIARWQGATSPEALDALLARFARFGDLMDRHIGTLREGLAEQRTQAASIVDRTIASLDELLSTSGETSPLIPLARPQDEAARRRIAEAIDRSIQPALARYRDFLVSAYRPHARADAGLWATPDGDAAYRSEVRMYTDLELGPEEIHAIGLEEAARIKQEMDELAPELGHANRREARQWAKDLPTADPPERILDIAREYIAAATEAAPSWFSRIPAQPCAVTPVPSFLADVDPGGSYMPGSVDGSRGGTYFLNPARSTWFPLLIMPTLTFHEAVPGHHFQMASELERPNASRFRRIAASVRFELFTSFIEGWGLYAERLADEMGLYRTPLERFGMLEYQDDRALRLVVDTGIHALRWTREEAVDRIVELFEGAMSREQAESIVDRYTLWPAQALAYMLGQRAIQDARRAASQQLGAAFDLRTFHDQVIGHGSVPIPILQREIVGWMRTA